MAILELRKAGDLILKKTAAPVAKIDNSIKKLLTDMAETMYNFDGVGLAAPQIGVSLQVIVVDIGDGLLELINPQIIASEGLETENEGCLSVPYMTGKVERFKKVTVEGFDRNGKKISIRDAEGLFARAIQHEIDHLNGILFIERAQSLQMLEKY
jgi:peptide deformylase